MGHAGLGSRSVTAPPKEPLKTPGGLWEPKISLDCSLNSPGVMDVRALESWMSAPKMLVFPGCRGLTGDKSTNKHKTHKHFSDAPPWTIAPGTNPTYHRDKWDKMAVLLCTYTENGRFVPGTIWLQTVQKCPQSVEKVFLDTLGTLLGHSGAGPRGHADTPSNTPREHSWGHWVRERPKFLTMDVHSDEPPQSVRFLFVENGCWKGF